MKRIADLASSLSFPLLLAACQNGGSSDDAGGTTGDAGEQTTLATGSADDTTPGADATGSDSGAQCVGECQVDDDCLTGQECIGCICWGVPTVICEMWGEGNYGVCQTNAEGVVSGECGADRCIYPEPNPSQYGFCSMLECSDVCDCPEPPEGFDAQVTCDDIGLGVASCNISCANGDACPAGMECYDESYCTWPSPPPVIPTYGECASDIFGVCESEGICVGETEAFPYTFCSSSCTDAGDCPAPPSGDAVPACVDQGGTLGCQLACAGGETCPTGMTCTADEICAWEPTWDACFSADACVPEQECLGGVAAGDFGGLCVGTCQSAADCPTAPAGSTAACGDLDTDGASECYLDCSENACPTGMQCADAGYCIADDEGSPYDDCANNPAAICIEGEACVTQTVTAGAAALCSQSECADASECPPPPADTAVTAACGDIDGEAGNECYFDCTGDLACPDGMVCSDASACAWPSEGFVLQETFEHGQLRPGWTVVDVDMGIMSPGLPQYYNGLTMPGEWTVQSLTVNDVTTFAAGVTSYYTDEALQADDWLISPPIVVSVSSQLSFEARILDEDFPDEYEVYISTGSTPADFLATTPILAVAETDATEAWQPHTVALDDALAGQTVHVAFRNPTQLGTALYIDNIRVTE